MVMSGQKTLTWRFFDDQGLSVGDDVELREYGAHEPFAAGKITAVTEELLGELAAMGGSARHAFPDGDEKRLSLRSDSGQPIGPSTLVKIVRFKVTREF